MTKTTVGSLPREWEGRRKKIVTKGDPKLATNELATKDLKNVAKRGVQQKGPAYQLWGARQVVQGTRKGKD